MNLNTEITQIAQRLIEFKTVSKNGAAFKECLNYIKSYFKSPKFYIKEITNSGSKSLLFSNNKIQRGAKYDLILHGHVDVVEGTPNQFKSKIVGNKLFGRGALDMKGGVAVIMKLLKDSTFSSTDKKSILLIITSDEEIGGENGTKYILDKFMFKGEMFISAEGEKDYLIKTKQKGVLQLEITSSTLGGHSAYTWDGSNAIEILLEYLNKAKRLFPQKKDPKHWYTTFNISKFNAGTSNNSAPSVASCVVDIRYTEDWTSKKIVKNLQNIANKYSDISIKVLYETNVMMNKNDKNIVILNNISKKVINSSSDLYFFNHGTNDARYASSFGIPAVAFGPVGNNYHAKDEWVDIRSLLNYYKILKELLTKI